MQLPAPTIGHILVHGLAHLPEPGHGSGFWKIVGRAMSDYDRWRRWLAENGQSYAGI